VVSNLFSIRFDDSPSPSTEAVMPGRDAPVRDYFAGPENALLGHVIANDSIPDEANYPLLMFGPSGVGKSHLLRGMVERFRRVRPDALPRLSCGADFSREFCQAQEVGSLAEVRQQLRDVDCFALDDVHALADKPHAQLELLCLLDRLKNRQASILVTSRAAPHELPLMPLLKSRLCGGLTIPIHVPSLATRQAFVQRFAAELEVELSAQVVDRLAQVTPATIPELRGFLLQLKQVQSDESAPIDLELVSRVIEQRAGKHVPGAREIIKKVARYFGLTAAELTGPSRRQTTVLARDTAIFLTRHLRRDSFERIGTYFGGRDHSTVMHAFQKITKQRRDSLVNAAIVELLQRLGMQHHSL